MDPVGPTSNAVQGSRRRADFYAKVFRHWKVNHGRSSNSHTSRTANKWHRRRHMQPDREGPWRATSSYVAVGRPRRKGTQDEKAGGKIHVEEQEIAGMGWLSLFTGPEGRMNGHLQPMRRRPAKKAKKKK